MADVIHTSDSDRSGAGVAFGIVLGILLALALLVGAWWLFFRPAAVETPGTIIEQEQPQQEQPQQQAPQGDTDIDIQQDSGGGGATETSPAP